MQFAGMLCTLGNRLMTLYMDIYRCKCTQRDVMLLCLLGNIVLARSTPTYIVLEFNDHLLKDIQQMCRKRALSQPPMGSLLTF